MNKHESPFDLPSAHDPRFHLDEQIARAATRYIFEKQTMDELRKESRNIALGRSGLYFGVLADKTHIDTSPPNKFAAFRGYSEDVPVSNITYQRDAARDRFAIECADMAAAFPPLVYVDREPAEITDYDLVTTDMPEHEIITPYSYKMKIELEPGKTREDYRWTPDNILDTFTRWDIRPVQAPRGLTD